MRFTFTLRGSSHTLSMLDGAVALRGGSTRGGGESTRDILKSVQSESAPDDSSGGRFGIELPASNRKLFERAGWIFAAPREHLTRAAATRGSAGDAETVQPVFVDRGGNTLVGSSLVTAQLPADMSARDVTAAFKKAGLRMERQLGFAPNLYQARLDGKTPFVDLLPRLQNNQAFLLLEPEFFQVLGGRRSPPAPKHPTPNPAQWQHLNAGGNGGKKGADGRSAKAWKLATGKGVRVAFIDNGMHINHPDLKKALFRGGHFEGDGTGSAAFVTRSADGTGFPTGNHGTFCLGMAGARFTSKQQVFGSAPECDLIPIACLPDQIGTQTTLARAIAYAANPAMEDAAASAADGADVIGCSLGPNGGVWLMTSTLDLAIRSAAAGRDGRGVPIFWAVSNGSFDISDDEVSSHPDVIAVGRSNRLDLEDGSASGPKLELLAPGREVYSTSGARGYAVGTGTSYACPFAAGVAALILQRFPALTRNELRLRLQQSCDKISGVTFDPQGHNLLYGYGRINAEQAVQ